MNHFLLREIAEDKQFDNIAENLATVVKTNNITILDVFTVSNKIKERFFMVISLQTSPKTEA